LPVRKLRTHLCLPHSKKPPPRRRLITAASADQEPEWGGGGLSFPSEIPSPFPRLERGSSHRRPLLSAYAPVADATHPEKVEEEMDPFVFLTAGQRVPNSRELVLPSSKVLRFFPRFSISPQTSSLMHTKKQGALAHTFSLLDLKSSLVIPLPTPRLRDFPSFLFSRLSFATRGRSGFPFPSGPYSM